MTVIKDIASRYRIGPNEVREAAKTTPVWLNSCQKAEEKIVVGFFVALQDAIENRSKGTVDDWQLRDGRIHFKVEWDTREDTFPGIAQLQAAAKAEYFPLIPEDLQGGQAEPGVLKDGFIRQTLREIKAELPKLESWSGATCGGSGFKENEGGYKLWLSLSVDQQDSQETAERSDS